jgi:hypothetical protein
MVKRQSQSPSRGSMAGSREGKVEGSTSARDDGERKLTTTDQGQAARPSPSRSDRHGGPKPVTQHRGHS